MTTISSQPISLPLNNTSADYPMGSYSGSNSGSFNPASYTRQFMGSPISWRAGSLSGPGGRFNGSPMDHFIGSLESAHDIKFKPSSSVENDRWNLRNAHQVLDSEGELCRNYTCCGLRLTDLHALLEHFEEVHVVVIDQPSAPGGQQAQLHIPFNPQAIPANPAQQAHVVQAPQSGHSVSHQPPTQQSTPQQTQYSAPFDVDDMEIESDVPQQAVSSRSSPSSMESAGALTPPDTPITTPLSAYPSPLALSKGILPGKLQIPHTPLSPYSNTTSPYTSQPPSPQSHHPMGGGGPISVFDTTTVVRPTVTAPSSRPSLNLNLTKSFSRPTTPQARVEPFNSYARYAADYSVGMPGATLDGESVGIPGLDSSGIYQVKTENEGCVHPASLFSSNTPAPIAEEIPILEASRVSTPAIQHNSQPVSPAPSAAMASAGSSTSAPPTPTGHSPTKLTTSLNRPAASFMLSSKPFKCPKPNCNKSYKQANGLKYHITHGSCNFAPPKDLEHVQALIDRKRRERCEEDGTLDSQSSEITEVELREVEREAEKRLRPFACGVGDCSRRYKNMNGLRYHYQHSGEHGAVGLALLASGVHECLNHGGGAGREASREREGRKVRGPNSKPSSRATSLSRTSTPVSVLAQAHQYQQQQTSFAEATAQVQAQAQLAYQQRFAEHQRAQYQQQQQQQQPASDPQMKQIQVQFAAMQSRIYSGPGGDASMSG